MPCRGSTERGEGHISQRRQCPQAGLAAWRVHFLQETMLASLTPSDQPHLCGECLVEGHRRGLALAPFAPHNSTMAPDLTDDDKAVLVERLRETIERDRFPLSPKVKRLKAVLAKLDPPAPRSEPIGH